VLRVAIDDVLEAMPTDDLAAIWKVLWTVAGCSRPPARASRRPAWRIHFPGPSVE